MNTDLLRTFLEVSRTRHFGQAAENLYLTQSAVSSRIKQLESLVGVPLFTRERNKILLTISGERLLPHAENMLAAWQLALQEVGVPQSQSLQLALGGTSNLWETFLQRLLPRLVEEFPNLYIRTDTNSSQELTRALIAGRLDIAVMLDSPVNADLEVRCIGRLELILVSSSKGVSIQNVTETGHVFVDWGTAFNLEQAKLFEEPLVPALHTGQSQIALEFLLKYGGTAFLPTALIKPHLKRQSLHVVEGADRASSEVNLVYSKSSEKLGRLRPVIQWFYSLDLELM